MTPRLQIVLAAAVTSGLLVEIVRRRAERTGLLDRPNDRSSHTIPTPRGGGIGIIAAILGVWVLFAPDSFGGLPLLLAVLGVGIVALIGWWDDVRGGVSPRHRLIAHVAASLLIVPIASQSPVLGLAAPPVVAWWVFWSVASINVVNFMDGIDGIIGAQAVVFGLHLSVGSADGASVGAAALVGASAGFLIHNWSPARVFMGDVGSGALGVLFVVLGALTIAEGRHDLFSAFMPLAPLFLDSTVTLLRRASRGERLTVAHRSHLYQRLVQAGLSHGRVSLAYAAIAALGAIVTRVSPLGSGVTLIIYLAFSGGVGWLASRFTSATPA